MEVHSGFADEQARYVTCPLLLASFVHPNKEKHPQHRNNHTLRCSAGTLTAQRVVHHSRRPLSRRGARAPRRCLPSPSITKCERQCGWLWDAPCRESELCELGRQQLRRTSDAHQQRGGPDPDCTRQVLGLRPRLGRGPHHGLRPMGKLPW